MSTSPVNKQITLSFGWKGPNTELTRWGEQRVGVVNLLFKTVPHNEVSVGISDELSADKVNQLCFTLRTYYSLFTTEGVAQRVLQNKQHTKTLDIAIDDMKDIRIRAGFFQISRTTTSVIRSDKEIEFKAPELESGQKYKLLITSTENLELHASIVKEEPTTDNLLSPQIRKVESLIKAALVKLLVEQVDIFTITMHRAREKFVLNDTQKVTAASDAFRETLRKIEPKALTDITTKIDTLHARSTTASMMEKNKLSKAIFQAFFMAIGEKGLMDMMYTTMVKSFQNPLPADRLMQVCEKFMNVYIQKLN